MKRLAILAACASLGACQTLSHASQAAEQVDTAAASAYATAAVAINTYETLPNADKVKAEALRAQAWTLFQKEHALYKSGIVGDITALQAVAAQAASLGK